MHVTGRWAAAAAALVSLAAMAGCSDVGPGGPAAVVPGGSPLGTVQASSIGFGATVLTPSGTQPFSASGIAANAPIVTNATQVGGTETLTVTVPANTTDLYVGVSRGGRVQPGYYDIQLNNLAERSPARGPEGAGPEDAGPEDAGPEGAGRQDHGRQDDTRTDVTVSFPAPSATEAILLSARLSDGTLTPEYKVPRLGTITLLGAYFVGLELASARTR